MSELSASCWMNAQSSSDGARSAQFHVTTETEHRRHSAATATSAATSVNLTMIPQAHPEFWPSFVRNHRRCVS